MVEVDRAGTIRYVVVETQEANTISVVIDAIRQLWHVSSIDQ